MEQNVVKGLDLKIDPSIHELCKISNNASSNTRSVLYLIIVVNVLSLIAVLNTHKSAWIEDRIKREYSDIKYHRNQSKIHQDSAAWESELAQKRLDYYIRSKIENYQVVKLPVFGYLFDVNDLAVVVGFSLVILLIVLRFTIIREGSNLNIALHSVSERYPPDANEQDFAQFLENAKGDNLIKTRLLSDINHTRREHHYNYLSMNEIFNFPPVNLVSRADPKTLGHKSRIATSIFWVPSISYLMVFLNDLMTLDIANAIQELHTAISFGASAIFLVLITWLCWKCNYREGLISRVYINFYKNNFLYV